jgi:hypothetical protein
MLNVADLLSYKMLVLDVAAVKRIDEIWNTKGAGKSKEKAG